MPVAGVGGDDDQDSDDSGDDRNYGAGYDVVEYISGDNFYRGLV